MWYWVLPVSYTHLKQVTEKEEKIMRYLHEAELEYRKKLKEITIQQILSDV